MIMKKEIYISVDVEASGPIPGEFNMLSFGACVVSDIKQTFYAELKPINDNYIERALNVSGFSMEELKEKGAEPAKAMDDFAVWISQVCGGEGRPVFVGFNATFDWSFVNYYFHRFCQKNPFGISGLDIKAYYMGMKKCTWGETAKRRIDQKFKSSKPHTHNALDDAIEQAEMFEKMRSIKIERK
jgi:DNA polymerase III epsilon subunit-like protein